jgi:hypothetical protein
VKRSFQFTLSLKRNRYVAIAIRFFVNLIASIDSDELPAQSPCPLRPSVHVLKVA